jgi:hypothetical protein
MRIIVKVLILFVAGLMLFSCKNKEEKLITERIQYDVTIKSPDPEWDWWIQNLDGPRREDFVKMILNAAYSGKVKSFDYDYKPITAEQVKAIDNRTDTIVMSSPVPPYNDTTVVVKRQLELQKIVRVRFLEEWTMNENTLEFTKKVLGIAPIKEVYGDDGEFRGYTPLFWVFLDKEYPGKLPVR